MELLLALFGGVLLMGVVLALGGIIMVVCVYIGLRIAHSDEQGRRQKR